MLTKTVLATCFAATLALGAVQTAQRLVALFDTDTQQVQGTGGRGVAN